MQSQNFGQGKQKRHDILKAEPEKWQRKFLWRSDVTLKIIYRVECNGIPHTTMWHINSFLIKMQRNFRQIFTMRMH
jgi:hypothetical protein